MKHMTKKERLYLRELAKKQEQYAASERNQKAIQNICLEKGRTDITLKDLWVNTNAQETSVRSFWESGRSWMKKDFGNISAKPWIRQRGSK